MTPDERAEKIADAIGINPNWGREKSVQYYAAEIRAAVEEAGQECSKCKRAHAKYCAECFEGEKRAAVEEAFECARNDADRREHIEWLKAQAKADAYEDAAKIAEDLECDQDTGAPLTRIAEAIRARAAEVSK